jgi:hypothetical protein
MVFYMKKILRMTKVVRTVKVREILRDMLAELPDEALLEKYQLNWKQLGKIYTKLFYGGLLSDELMLTRIELRQGKDASHIPLVQIDGSGTIYECLVCGYISALHFSECPRCRQINLRRLSRRVPARDYAAYSARYAAS